MIRPPTLAARALIGAVRLYQRTLSHVVGGQCRFRPTCSQYSIDALRLHGAAGGVWLTVRRIARCHPWGGCGFDPPPGDEADAASALSARTRGSDS